jgi:beta-glucosidase
MTAALEHLRSICRPSLDSAEHNRTLLDNFEWTAGFAMTFGRIAVDRQTFARTVKLSARWLGDVAGPNRLP